MPTIRISDSNYHRLQQFAIPLEDTADQAMGRVLDVAEDARRRGLYPNPHNKTNINGSIVTVNKDRHDIKLAARLENIAVPAKEGDTMTRWEHKRTGTRFWITKKGAPRVYLPRRGFWPSDTNHKVLHFKNPNSGWQKYDQLYLRDNDDIEYALKILADLDTK